MNEMIQYDPKTGEVARRRGEKATAAQAAMAKAEIESRFAMASYNPRAQMEVRSRLLKDCDRPEFAEVAAYAKPVGKKNGQMQYATGPSIRFVESALRAMRNVDVSTTTYYDDDDMRIVQVQVTDLESNVTHKKQLTIAKTVERRFLKKGQESLGERVNSYGDTVYTVRATEDDMLLKESAQVAKAVRTMGLRIIDGDLVADAMKRCQRTLQNQDASDPKAAIKRVVDAFERINVSPGDLQQYLGHAVEKTSPAEIDDLRGIYAAIAGGETTWSAVMAEAVIDADEASEAEQTTKKAAKKAKDKLQGKGKKKPEPEPEAPEVDDDPPPMSDEEKEAIEAEEREAAQGGLI